MQCSRYTLPIYDWLEETCGRKWKCIEEAKTGRLVGRKVQEMEV